MSVLDTDARLPLTDVRLPLTAAQLGVWAAQQLDPGTPRYNCASYLEIHGRVDGPLLARAVRGALGDAEALRVRLDGGDDAEGPGQRVLPVPAAPLEFLDVTGAARPRAAAEEWMRADLSTAVDPTRGPLVRHVLITDGPDSRLLYLRYHHIVMDGLGQTVHVRRIAEWYTALAAGTAPPASRALPLADLVAADAAYPRAAGYARDRAYWLRKYADVPDPVSLADTGGGTGRGLLRRTVQLSEPDLELLRDTARRLGARTSALLLAAVAAYQCRITGRPETLLGLPVPARNPAAAIGTPGMFANELPVRVAAAATTTFATLVADVSAQLGEVLRHQRFRGEELHRRLLPEGARRTLAGTTVNVVSFDADVTFGTLPSTAHHLSSGPVDDLQLDFFSDARGTRMQLNIDAAPDRHTPAALAAHAERLPALLRHALAAPDTPVGRLPLMTGTERAAVLAASAPVPRDHDLSRRLPDLVEAQAARTPDATAAQVDGAALTYRELAARARGLAAHLVRQGVARGAVVGVHQERSLDLVVSLLGTMLAGAAYLPLDPELPPARLRLMLDDAGVAAVLSTARLAGRLPDGTGARVVAVDELPAGPAPSAAELPPGDPSDTAYVIYTSGSTGTPKGVAVPHRAVLNRLLWMQDEYRLDAGECVLQKTPFTFDVSVWEFFWPLLAGARLHLAEPGAHRDPRALARTMRAHRVTTVHFVPPVLDAFLAEPDAAELPALRRVVCSGEALGPGTVTRFLQVYGRGAGAPELFNLYGPTEAAVDVTHWRCTARDTAGPVPIGRAVANTGLYVLDPGGEPLPFGVPGELYIGGVQVASGYLDRPELTAERFVPDPFGDGRLYRTGDLAVLRDDGVLEYRGRTDQQVKIRGVRIEPGEVEAALRALDGVEAAVVTAPAHGAGRRLLAHVVAPGLSEDALTAALGQRLPGHLVPSRIVLLDALPLLSSGKVDRQALPAPREQADATDRPGAGGRKPAAGTTPTAPTAPATPAERLVHDAFAEVLDRARVDLDASFFALGGDSILSIRMRAVLERAGLTFTPADLYDTPTVRTLAPRTRPCDRTGERTAPFALLTPADTALLPDGLADAYPLSSMQTAMVFHADYEQGSSVYRVVTSVRLALPFDEDALRAALAGTFRRHPALRSSFRLTGYSEPVQLVHREVDVPLRVDESLRGAGAEQRERGLRGWAEAAKHHDFDLTAAPLLAFTAHPLGPDSFQLSVVEHHVVLDGWSDAAMLDEIAERYRAALAGEDLWLPELPTAYRDFVAAERAAAADRAHRAFWAGELAGAEPAPLPLRPPGSAGPPAHRRFDVPVDEATAARVTRAAHAAGLPVKALLTAVHAAVLHRVAPGDEVLTGVVAHGRLERDGGDQVIGVFLNTLPLRLKMPGGSWLDLARAVHAHERRTAPHRRYPYARMLRETAGLAPDSYVNFMDFHLRWGAGTAVEDGFGIAETDFPLAVNFLVDPAGGRLGLWLDCDTARLDEAFCTRLAGYYARALAALGAAPEAAPPDDLRRTAELALLREWNDTAVPFDTAASVHGLIDARIATTPDAPAVLDGGRRLSYAELGARADRLAGRLRERGARPRGRVGVSVRRGVDLVVALLAVLRTGAGYVPMDPDYPAERLRHIADDAALDCLVVSGAAPDGLPPLPVVDVDTDTDTDTDERTKPQPRPATGPRPPQAGPDDPVYVIYTSGSTGRPKGTVLHHRNVVNFLTGMDRAVGIGPADVVLALTSVSFDISVLELLWPLTRGASVVVAGERMIERLARADGDGSLPELCARHAPTLLQATPSFLAAVAAQPEALQALGSLRALLVGGEAFPSGLARRLLAALPEVRVCNMYGPTETTIWSTVHELDRERDVHAASLPIGRPIANTRVHVAAPDGGATPVGVAGELWIGGEGVAAGYLGRPELTAERFVRMAGERFYRTGDRVRWRSDGVLEFLGRVDRQVKILGHRIEPDEVEDVLSRHPAVASVAVVAAPRAAGGPELVAYVAPVGDDRSGDGEQRHLQRWRDVWEGAYRAPDEPAGSSAAALSGAAALPDPAARAAAPAGPGTPERDFAGWLSSYTKQPIPADEMREWLACTVRRIRATGPGPGAIVDVGVGVGLYLRELAPAASSYLGVDLSPAALAAAAAAVSRDGAPPGHVTLRQGDALALAELPAGSADLVLFNSVVQYFPSPDYLERALAEAVRVAGASGAVFVGDVRDLDLLPYFHADTQLRRVPALTPAGDVAAAAARAMADERELCLTAGFFHRFAARHGLGVRVELKRGRFANELTRFRRDVTLLGPGHPDAAGARTGKQQSWTDLADLAGVARALAAAPPDEPLTVTDLPDRRLARPLAAHALLHAAPAAEDTAWDLERALWTSDGADACDPEDVALLGERHGRTVRLTQPASARTGQFDAVFEPITSDARERPAS